MTSAELKTLDEQYTLGTYARFDLCLQSGSGCRATDAEGNTYLDFTSGIGVNSLGFADAGWAKAVAAQAATLQHTSNLFYTEPPARLAKTLCRRTGMAKVFFCNSGAEANEGAIKAARKYSFLKYGEGRSTILTLQNSFHGRTMATVTATGQDGMHQFFHPFVPGFAYLPAGDVVALNEALEAGGVCAVMLEPIQGEGGVVPLPIPYLQEVQALCRAHDVLLVVDEVQSGVGRTGTFLAGEHAGLKPDIVTLAKGLGAGLPIGAVLLAESCCTALTKGDHGSTFGANPVCCAGANEVMARMDDAFLQNVRERGEQLAAGLAVLPQVENITGLGLMLGVRFKGGLAAADVQKAAMKNGLLCLLAKDKLRLLPPLILTKQEADEGLAILKQTLEAL